MEPTRLLTKFFLNLLTSKFKLKAWNMKINQIFWVQTAPFAKMVSMEKTIFGCYHVNTYFMWNALIFGSRKIQVAQCVSTSLRWINRIIKEQDSLKRQSQKIEKFIHNLTTINYYFTQTPPLVKMNHH